MKFTGTVVVKNKKNNGFFVMTPRDKMTLQKELEDRLYWICQLGSSKYKEDQKFYHDITQLADNIFGVSPHNDNRPNMAIGALAGVIDKLRRGDISEKQIKNITPVLQVFHIHYPHKWSAIEFEENVVNIEEAKETFNTLFEMVHNN